MLPPVDILFLSRELARLGEEIQRAADEAAVSLATHPEVLTAGLLDLLDTLDDAERDSPGAPALALRAQTGGEPEGLLAHGLELIGELSRLAARLGQDQAARAVERLALPLACWMLRRGTELSFPEPVVNAAAALANSLKKPEELAELFGLMTEVVDGMSPLRTQEPDGGPTRPWRVLLLNRAIVATRSHRPALMTEAFKSVCEQLPEDAPDFFREGMGQMDALGYPQPVREVMERYYEIWCARQRLH